MQRRIRNLVKDASHRLSFARGPRAILVVLGCQRSGTSMMLRAIDQDWDAKVFGEFSSINLPAGPGHHEGDPRQQFSIRMRPLAQVDAELARLRYRIVALKPLVESQRAAEILESIDGARLVWMYRDYRDVSRSIVGTFGKDIHRRNLEPIIRSEPGNWRSESVAEDVRAVVANHYSPDMDPLDGAALFWYARNRLFLDQALAGNERVLLLSYEDLVAEPVAMLARVYGFAGLGTPVSRVAKGIHARAVGAGRQSTPSPEISELCEGLTHRLEVAGRSLDQGSVISPRPAPAESRSGE